MKYKDIELTPTGKALTCPVCENENIRPSGTHCKICGVNLIQNDSFNYEC